LTESLELQHGDATAPRRRVGVDYHVDIDAHYYSVPYRFARAEVEARLTARGVEIFHKGERIAVHLRSSGNRKHTTIPEHMPSSHRRYAGWTIERIREDAAVTPDIHPIGARVGG
jgi:transposase